MSSLSPQNSQNIDSFTHLSPLNANTSSYNTPVDLQVENKHSEDINAIAKLAKKILEDPLLQIKLTQRVYKLMQEDLTYYTERGRSYGGRI